MILTVRALEACKDFSIQEFTRIIFVDNIANYSTKIGDHEPFKDRQAYETLDVPRIVSLSIDAISL